MISFGATPIPLGVVPHPVIRAAVIPAARSMIAFHPIGRLFFIVSPLSVGLLSPHQPSVSDDTDSRSSYRHFALVAFAAILGYGSVADAEAAALRVFLSGPDASLSVSVSIPLPTGPTQGNTTCTQGNGEGVCGNQGDGSNC